MITEWLEDPRFSTGTGWSVGGARAATHARRWPICDTRQRCDQCAGVHRIWTMESCCAAGISSAGVDGHRLLCVEFLCKACSRLWQSPKPAMRLHHLKVPIGMVLHRAHVGMHAGHVW